MDTAIVLQLFIQCKVKQEIAADSDHALQWLAVTIDVWHTIAENIITKTDINPSKCRGGLN